VGVRSRFGSPGAIVAVSAGIVGEDLIASEHTFQLTESFLATLRN
jgi:hypothetical protein